MWLDAILAYLHYTAIFMLFGFLVTEAMFFRGSLDEKGVRLLGRIDLWYFGSAIAALATGVLRLVFGAKGPDFYLNAWPIYAKIGVFVVIAIISVRPTKTFVRWRRALDHDPDWRVPEAERARARRLVMVQLHLAALLPLFAVIMSRGLAR